jgi:hypothetical protein
LLQKFEWKNFKPWIFSAHSTPVDHLSKCKCSLILLK